MTGPPSGQAVLVTGALGCLGAWAVRELLTAGIAVVGFDSTDNTRRLRQITPSDLVDRVRLVNPGEEVTLGNRTLMAVKPPVFDNPCTTGFYDKTSGVFFSSDCFGALLQAVPENAAEIPEQDLRDGQVLWATIDSPWLHKVDRHAFAVELDAIRSIAPTLILSNHLPPAPGRLMERFLGSLTASPGASPFVGPNQAALEQMLKQMAEAPAGV